jgi:hypothetical protein
MRRYTKVQVLSETLTRIVHFMQTSMLDTMYIS